jgi:tetratricopeptide (TPR) repeat protein
VQPPEIESFWKELLTFVEAGCVIPVSRQGVKTRQEDDQPYYHQLVRRLADRLGVTLPEGAPVVELLLSVLYTELNALRKNVDEVTRPERLEGQMERLLAQYYHRSMEMHPAAIRTFLEDRLVSADGNRESTEADTAISAFREAGLSDKTADATLQRLLDDRILLEGPGDGVRSVRFTHDILAGIARRNRDFRREQEVTEERLQERAHLIRWTVVLALLFVGVSVPLAVWGLRENERANEREAVVRKTGQAVVERSREVEKLLYEAARTDRLIASEKLGRGDQKEAFAHLARALQYDPTSTVAAEMAFHSILASRRNTQSIRLEGFAVEVRFPQFSSDGQSVVAACEDRTARIWDAKTGRGMAKLEGHTDFVWSAEFSPDGRLVVTASEDRTARIWDTVTGHEVARLEGHTDGVKSAKFSSDGRRVVTASADNTARIWDSVTGRQIAELDGHTDSVQSAEFRADGQRVVTASTDGTVRIWDTNTGQLVGRLRGNTGRAGAVKFGSDRQLLLLNAFSGSAGIWPIPTWDKAPPSWFGEFLVWVGGARIAEDGRIVPLPYAEREDLDKKLHGFSGEASAYGDLLRWRLAPPHQRPLFPGGRQTRGERAAIVLKQAQSEPSSECAYNLDPSLPLVHIELAGFQQEREVKEFLQNYGMVRLPNELRILTSAAKLLFDQGSPDKALQLTERALQIAPEDWIALYRRSVCYEALGVKHGPIAP